MAQLLHLDTFTAESGNLTVIEKILPGPIKQIFYVHEADEKWQIGRRHQTAWHALVCLRGNCRICSDDGVQEQYFELDDPQKCLLLEPKDWHLIEQFANGSLLLVISNQPHDPADYIYEKYSKRTHGL